MKHSWMIIGLAVMSAGLVFGQPQAGSLPSSTNPVACEASQAMPVPPPTCVLPGDLGPGVVQNLPPYVPTVAPPPDLPLPPPAVPLSPALPGQPMLPPAMPTQPVLPGLPAQVVPGRLGQSTFGSPEILPAKASMPPDCSVSASTADNASSRQEPAVRLEWMGPNTARLNQQATFQITAKNISAGPVHNVVVRHRIPTGMRVAGTEPKAVNDGNMLTWDLGTLMSNQEKRIELQLVAEAKVEFTCQAAVTFTGWSTHKVQVREPKLLLKVTVPEKVVEGETATVSMTVSNAGDGQADHVKLKALLPEGLEHARGKVIEVEVGNLAAGENRTVQLVCMTKVTGPHVVDCAAVADAGLSAQETAKLEVVLPRLDLVVSGPRLRYLERPATYTLKVINPGNAAASNVSINYQLPQGFKFQTASNGGRHDLTMRAVSWFIGDLLPGESREVTLEVVASSIGDYKHVAFATAARGLKAEGEIVTRVEGLSALLMELSDTDDPIEVGSTTSYEIRVSNTGSKTETNVELVCTVPDKMEFRGARSSAGCKYRVEGHEVIFEPMPRLAPRADSIYHVTMRGLAPGDLRFRARLRAEGFSEPMLREESTKVYSDEVSPR